MALSQFNEEMEREIESLQATIKGLRALLPDVDVDKWCGVRLPTPLPACPERGCWPYSPSSTDA